MEPAPLFLPREFHGQWGLAGYSPWGRRVRHDWAHTQNSAHHSVWGTVPVSFVLIVLVCLGDIYVPSLSQWLLEGWWWLEFLPDPTCKYRVSLFSALLALSIWSGSVFNLAKSLILSLNLKHLLTAEGGEENREVPRWWILVREKGRLDCNSCWNK